MLKATSWRILRAWNAGVANFLEILRRQSIMRVSFMSITHRGLFSACNLHGLWLLPQWSQLSQQVALLKFVVRSGLFRKHASRGDIQKVSYQRVCWTLSAMQIMLSPLSCTKDPSDHWNQVKIDPSNWRFGDCTRKLIITDHPTLILGGSGG